MLAAAHVLAMDAKNLLDVVDCIRERHPDVDWRSGLAPEPPRARAPHCPSLAPEPPRGHAPPCADLAPQNPPTSPASDEPRPEFRINQPVTAPESFEAPREPPREHSSLPNRVSTLIHNYNLYGNVREEHVYGNEESKGEPGESVRSRVQALTGKLLEQGVQNVQTVQAVQADQG